MKLEIIDKREDSLRNRELVSVKGFAEGPTPSRKTIKKDIASKLKTKEELMQVRKITTKFGDNSFGADIYIYKDKKQLERLESAKYKKKNAPVKKEEKPKKKVEEKTEVPKEKNKNGKKESS